MNPTPPEFLSDGSGNRPSPRRELQGPRPAALRVNQSSHKIRKPPVAPPHHHHQPPPRAAAAEDRQPVIIYSVSPKVIHTTASDFMNLVQRLTGNSTDEVASSSAAGNLSPAARLASIEQASPKAGQIRAQNGQIRAQNESDEANLMGDFDWETESRAPGILSPAPGSLPPISPGFFSPSVDPFMMGYNMFIPSPGTLFSAPMVSPSPSSDPFNPLFDF